MLLPAVETFLANLEKSNLLSTEALQTVREEVGRDDGPLTVEQLAPRLVDRGLLTPWQVDELVAGRTNFFLGKYKLLGELGRGGMGAVYKAVQTRLGRVVALKVMASKLVSDEQAVARFHREIEAVAALDSPHVVAAFDADQVDGTHFLVMEYVDGESLAAVLKRQNRLPVVTACDYIHQAAVGLAHAQERGMAHRDIKPANLLIARTADGQPLVKILDMGLARFTVEHGEETELTSTGQVMGTPDYIAPEQARSTKSADIRSDIYSLGCTLFRCLTGRLPFDGESVMEKLMARAMGDAPLIRQYLPEAPAALETVVARMLAREPAARYQSPAEVAAALGPFSVKNPAGVAASSRTRASAPVASRDPGVDQFLKQLVHEAEVDESGETIADGAGTQISMPGEPMRTKGKLLARVEERSRADRRRIVQAAIGTLLLAVAAAGAWGWWMAGQTQLVFDWPADERAGAELEVDGYSLTVPEHSQIRVPPGRAGRRRIHLVRPGYETIDETLEFARGQRRSYRPEWIPSAATIRQQRLADLESRTDSLRKQFFGRLPPSDNAELQALRQRFADLRPNFRSTGDQQRFDRLWRRLPFPADYLRMATPSEEILALEPQLAESLPNELAAAWGDARLKAPAGASVAVSPDGRLAATWSPDRTVYLWDLESGRLDAPPVAPFDCVGPPHFSPDGKFLVFLADDIVIWSIDERRAVKAISLPVKGAANSYTWIPGSSLMAWTNEVHAVHLWNIETGEHQEDLPFPLDDALHIVGILAASRDGRFLAAGSSSKRLRIWEIATQQWFDLPTEGSPYSLAFSPDGSQLAAGIDYSICLWDVVTRELCYRKSVTLNWGINSLSWRPDGKVFSSNTGTGAIALWNAADGTLQTHLSTRGHTNTLAAFSQDGRRLVTSGGDGLVQVWDADSHEELLPTGPRFISAAMDPLGEWVAICTGDKTIEIRDLRNGAIREAISLPFVASQLAVSPDRNLLGLVAAPPDFSVHVVPLDGGHELRELREMAPAQALAFTPDGRLLLVLAWGGQEVSAWSTDDSKLSFKAQLANPKLPTFGSQMAVSGDNRLFVVVGGTSLNGSLSAFSLPDGKNLYFAAAYPVTDHVVIAGTPERAITSAGPYIQLVDLAKGEAKETVNVPGTSGPRVFVTGLNASPDGDHIVAALSDGHLWFVSAESLNAEGELDLRNRLMAPLQALYTPDGRHVVTVNANGTVCVWRIRDWGEPSEDQSETPE